jgi:hypothetical protein
VLGAHGFGREHEPPLFRRALALEPKRGDVHRHIEPLKAHPLLLAPVGGGGGQLVKVGAFSSSSSSSSFFFFEAAILTHPYNPMMAQPAYAFDERYAAEGAVGQDHHFVA